MAEKGDGGEALRHPFRRLLADAQLGDERAITLHILALEIVQQAAALTDHPVEAAGRVLVLGILLQVSGQILDAAGEDGDLDLRGAGVVFVGAVGVDDLGLLLLAKHSVFPPFQNVCPGRLRLRPVEPKSEADGNHAHWRAQQAYHPFPRWYRAKMGDFCG